MTDKTVAVTILQQLGGNKFIAMTGAKNFYALDNGMGCKIGRNSKGVNHLKIILNAMDTYDMEFIRVRNDKITVVSKANDVYFDMLQEVFTEHTGLYTRLF